MKSGRVRALAVTSADPSALVPDLPTVSASSVPGYEAVSITGMWTTGQNTGGGHPTSQPGKIVRVLRECLPNTRAAAQGNKPVREMRHSIYLSWVIAGVVLALAFPVQADFTGKVVAIADGANITVQKDSEQVQVRLVGIDAPELEQGFGIRSRQAMSAVVFGKEVRVVEHGKAQDGRTLGRIYRGNLDVNADQVRKGMAWASPPYDKDASLYQIEAEAKAARRGLWLDPHPIPPWEWRRAKRGATG